MDNTIDMFGLFRKKADWKSAVAEGAPIIDVRTPAEFGQGHVPGSKNMPLHSLESWAGKFKSGQQVVLVCRSGARSGMATRALQSRGIDAINGGPWTTVNRQFSN